MEAEIECHNTDRGLEFVFLLFHMRYSHVALAFFVQVRVLCAYRITATPITKEKKGQKERKGGKREGEKRDVSVFCQTFFRVHPSGMATRNFLWLRNALRDICGR